MKELLIIFLWLIVLLLLFINIPVVFAEAAQWIIGIALFTAFISTMNYFDK